MQIRELESNEQELWDDALERLGVDHHAFSWQWRKILQQSFGHQPKYLLAQSANGSAELGILPLFHFKSALFGEALISVPYLNAGGIISNDSKATAALLDYADGIASSLGVSYLELRHGQEQPVPEKLDATRSHKVTMVLPLLSDPEELFSSFPPKLRSQIRRPTKSGLYAESIIGDKVSRAHIDELYSVFSEHMRDLGTPVYPKRLFRNTIGEFSIKCRLIIVRSGQKPVAVGLTIGAKQRTEILWASSLRSHNKLSPNMLLYWEALKGAAADGYTTFDFGRSSPDSGTFRFKKQWGAVAEELQWHYRLYKGELPDVSPSSAKFQFLVSCWKHLPLPVANMVGPYLTRGIP